MQLPSIDQNVCGDWSELDRSMYATLPYFFEQGRTQFRQRWEIWRPHLGKAQWKKRQGDEMRRVVIEPTPNMRQFATPSLIREIPTTDLIMTRERVAKAKLYAHDFESPAFYWEPDYSTFLGSHIMPAMDNINKQVMMYEETFYRTQILYQSPFVYVCGVGLVTAPTDPTQDDWGKNAAWWQNAVLAPLAGAGQNSANTLSFSELFKAQSAFVEDTGATPFSGSGLPGGDSSPLNEKYLLLQSSESWNEWIDDPWLKENRPLNMNIVNGAYRGDLFGRITSKLERYPLRIKQDNNYSPDFTVQPETTELNPDMPNYGRTLPNPVYSKPSQSPVEVAWLLGGAGYDAIDPGDPPPDFKKPLDGRGMDWSGKTWMTKDFLIPCKDADGNTQLQTNNRGRYLKLMASWAGGIIGGNTWNIMPIVYMRKRGLTTVLNTN